MDLSKPGIGIALAAVASACVAACNAGVRYDDVMIAPSSDMPTSTATAVDTVTPSAVATETATPQPSAAPKETKKLEVKARETDVDKAKDLVEWTPDRGVQKASYSHYRFKYAEWVAAVGEANLKSDVDVEAECAEAIEKTSKPADPNLPTPSGGFTNRTYECKVVRATVKK